MRKLALATALLFIGLAPAAAGSTAYPLTLTNCGADVRITAAPKRVVAIKSTSAEMLLSLGLADRILGVAFQDGPLPPSLSEAGKDLAILSPKLPSQEAVLAKEPDFLYGGWESNFAADGVGDRAFYSRLGVAAYVSPPACRSLKPEPLTFDAIFKEVREVGSIFDAEPAATTLIDRQTKMLSDLQPDARKLKAVWWSSGNGEPYVGGGTGAPALIMQTIGLTNAFADMKDGWSSVSWEAIAEADPDVIVLVDASWNSLAQKKKLLAENPVTAKLDAVVNNRYLTIDFPASQAGVRTAPAAIDLAAQLSRLVPSGG